MVSDTAFLILLAAFLLMVLNWLLLFRRNQRLLKELKEWQELCALQNQQLTKNLELFKQLEHMNVIGVVRENPDDPTFRYH